MTPIEAVAEMRARIEKGERCGVLFGRERNGLETAEVANADALIMIPVNASFASLNLAQAVLILGYDWMRGSDAAEPGPGHHLRIPDRSRGSTSATTGRRPKRSCSDSSSTSRVSSTGWASSTRRTSAPVWCDNLRTMLSRMGATEQEVRTLRGIVATLAKGRGQARKPST